MSQLRATTLTLAGLALLMTGCGGADVSQPAPASGAAVLFPPVEGFSYHAPGSYVAVFEDSATATLGEDPPLQILQAATATRGDDSVAVIAFSFPGTTDEQGVDAMARILDGLEDAFQAGSQRGLGGSAYVIRAEDETVVMAPWGRAQQLVFLFAVGPDQATRDLADAILSG